MTKLEFYYSPGACSLAPHILLHETGLPFTSTALLDLSTGATLPTTFARINPKLQVPVLALDDTTPITETPAIATAIAQLAPSHHLLGHSPLDTVRVYEWMNWLSGTLHTSAFKRVFRPQLFSNDLAAHPGIVAKGRESVGACFDVIEGKLALSGVYAVGGHLTAVDPYLFVFYRWGNAIGVEMKTAYPKYTALVENLVRRPAVRATLEVEGIESSL